MQQDWSVLKQWLTQSNNSFYYRKTVVAIDSELLKVNVVRKCQNMSFSEEISELIPQLRNLVYSP